MTQAVADGGQALADCTAKVVMAYIIRNRVPISALPSLIELVRSSLGGLDDNPRHDAVDLIKTEEQIRKSITPDGIFSFIDGRPYKVLRRHLRLNGLDPQAYRRRFGLPLDYPMVAQSYSKQRAGISREIKSRAVSTV